MKLVTVCVALVFCSFVHSSIEASSPGIGNGLWRTFNLAALISSLPFTAREAEKQKWQRMSPACEQERGFRYALKSSQSDFPSPQKNSPLTLYFTAGGQLSGVAVNVYGSAAAPATLIQKGYWIPVPGREPEFTLSLSFRNSSIMCSGDTSPEVIGDRVVINQGTLSQSIPLTAQAASCQKWTAGSCMRTMGQHWFYDVATAPVLSFQSQNLLPVVPMYWPNNINGTLSAIFFTTPLDQPGSNHLLNGPGDWEMPALSPSNMCQNFCNDGTCQWPGVKSWGTMHIYFNSQWSNIKCPGGAGPVGRYCPATPINYQCPK